MEKSHHLNIRISLEEKMRFYAFCRKRRSTPAQVIRALLKLFSSGELKIDKSTLQHLGD